MIADLKFWREIRIQEGLFAGRLHFACGCSGVDFINVVAVFSKDRMAAAKEMWRIHSKNSAIKDELLFGAGTVPAYIHH